MKRIKTFLAATALTLANPWAQGAAPQVGQKWAAVANDAIIAQTPQTDLWHPLQELDRIWDKLEMGITPEQTTKAIGIPPMAQDNSVNLGIAVTSLTWRDAWGGKWTAFFVFNRLVRKTTIRAG